MLPRDLVAFRPGSLAESGDARQRDGYRAGWKNGPSSRRPLRRSSPAGKQRTWNVPLADSSVWYRP